ncbi:MAG TPA: amino acid ABC transporter substrate-binding protein [Castellaniella sp.]|uniref:amino acid ABC transporter substrate-binding protein n=1 Tax=Castellaniella sp. TaxID=1955812 RepID=UPI002F00F043
MSILHRIGRKTLWPVAAALVGLAVAPVPSMAASPIIIGATSSDTGPLSADATENLMGMKLAVQQANDAGGWLGRKLELKTYDDESQPGTAVRLYTRLITEDHANLLVGPYSSGISKAVTPLFNKYKFAAIEPEASDPSIFNSSNHWAIQGLASSLGYLEQLLPLAKEHGAKTVAVLGLQSTFSLACYDARVDQAKKLGMNVVYKATYSMASADFNGMALATKNAKPDVVITCTYYPDSVGIVKALHAQGFAPKFLGSTIGPVSASFTKDVGPLANRIFSNTSWWPTYKTAGNQEFIAAYKKMFDGKEPTYHSAAGYSAIYVLGKAVAATKGLDQAKLRDWMLNHSVDTVQGPSKVNKNGRELGLLMEMVQVQNGQLKLITPPESAQAKPEIPYTGQ